MKTALIDNGIDEGTMSWFQNRFGVTSIRHYEVKNGQIRFSKPIRGKTTHGGSCAKVFAEQAGRLPDISICLRRDAQQLSNIEDLILALRWCLEHEVKLISLSMGTTDHMDGRRLYLITHQLYESGCIVIAAGSNEQCITYPAAFRSCLGVCTPRRVMLEKGEMTLIKEPLDGIDIVTYDVSMPEYEIYPCNSYATAYVSGLYVKYHCEYFNQEDMDCEWTGRMRLVSKEWVREYYADKMDFVCEDEPIIVTFKDRPEHNPIMEELYALIWEDDYSCCMILAGRSIRFLNQEISLIECPLEIQEVIRFVCQVFRMDVILLEDDRFAEKSADVLIVESYPLLKDTHADLLFCYDMITAKEIWKNMKKMYKN